MNSTSIQSDGRSSPGRAAILTALGEIQPGQVAFAPDFCQTFLLQPVLDVHGVLGDDAVPAREDEASVIVMHAVIFVVLEAGPNVGGLKELGGDVAQVKAASPGPFPGGARTTD